MNIEVGSIIITKNCPKEIGIILKIIESEVLEVSEVLEYMFFYDKYSNSFRLGSLGSYIFNLKRKNWIKLA